jgi:hypothetical protein
MPFLTADPCTQMISLCSSVLVALDLQMDHNIFALFEGALGLSCNVQKYHMFLIRYGEE